VTDGAIANNTADDQGGGIRSVTCSVTLTNARLTGNSASSASGGGVLLGQRRIDGKSNEITAVPELLRVLFIKGCIVTVDALNCQKDIARTVIEREADYVFALKANHPQ